MALTKVIYAPGTSVQSTNLNDIQDEIIADELRNTLTEYTPTINGVDGADISVAKGVFRRSGEGAATVELWTDVTWNNTVNDPASNALTVEISLPFQSADHGVIARPTASTALADSIQSIWPTAGADDYLQAWIVHVAPNHVLSFQRAQSNSSVGFLAVGNVLTQVRAHMVYFTDGVAIP